MPPLSSQLLLPPFPAPRWPHPPTPPPAKHAEEDTELTRDDIGGTFRSPRRLAQKKTQQKKAQKKAAEEAAAAAAAEAAAQAAAAAAAAERAARGTDWSETVISRADMLPGAAAGGGDLKPGAAAAAAAGGAAGGGAGASAAGGAPSPRGASSTKDALRASVLVAGAPLAKQVKDALWALRRSRSGRNPRGGLRAEAVTAATGHAAGPVSALGRALAAHARVAFDPSSGLFTYRAAHSAADADGLVEAVRAATMVGGGGDGAAAGAAAGGGEARERRQQQQQPTARSSSAVTVATFAPGAGLPAAELDDAYPGAAADVSKLIASGRLWSAPAAADFGQTAVLFVGAEARSSGSRGGGGGKRQRAAARAAAAAAAAAASAAASTDAAAALGARPVSRDVAVLWASHPPPPDASALAAGLRRWGNAAAAPRSAAARRSAAFAPRPRVRKQRDPDAPGAAPRVVTNAHMPELWNAGGPTSID